MAPATRKVPDIDPIIIAIEMPHVSPRGSSGKMVVVTVVLVVVCGSVVVVVVMVVVELV
jgi:hypothetical protein